LSVKLPYAGLSRELAAGKIAPVYVVSGTDEFVRELALREIESAVVDPSPGEPIEFNQERFDGQVGSTTAAAVILSANQLPLLGASAGRRLVLVRRARRLVEPTRRGSEGEESETAPAEVQALVEYVKDPAPRTVLVLEMEAPPDARRKTWKEIDRAAVVVECNPLKQWEVPEWIGRQAKKLDLRLGNEEVRYLAAEFGADQRRLSTELEKIAIYAAGARISMDELAELLGRGKAQHVFKFVDAVAGREPARALKQLNRLLDEGEPPFPILALLDRRVGQLLMAKEMGGRGKRGAQLAAALQIPPRAADELARHAEGFEEGELLTGIRALAETDRALKSTGLPARLLLERLVIQLAGGGQAGSDPRRRAARPPRELSAGRESPGEP
jgi:DNA polymerase-3 subunit delta